MLIKKIFFPVLSFFILFNMDARADTTVFNCSYSTFATPNNNDKVTVNKGKLNIQFLIDSESKKAYMVGNNGSNEVMMIANNGGFTLIEITGTGNVMTTTITWSLKSAHSRHTIIMTDFSPQQYYGNCTVK